MLAITREDIVFQNETLTIKHSLSKSFISSMVKRNMYLTVKVRTRRIEMHVFHIAPP